MSVHNRLIQYLTPGRRYSRQCGAAGKRDRDKQAENGGEFHEAERFLDSAGSSIVTMIAPCTEPVRQSSGSALAPTQCVARDRDTPPAVALSSSLNHLQLSGDQARGIYPQPSGRIPPPLLVARRASGPGVGGGDRGSALRGVRAIR